MAVTPSAVLNGGGFQFCYAFAKARYLALPMR